MLPGQCVLVDTNIIIEAVRTRCWGALTAHFRIETVERCCEEARTGQLHRPGYVVIEERTLRERLVANAVSDSDLALLSIEYANASNLDAGERHLWAHAFIREDAWIASTGDKAAFFAACQMGWRDRLISLEELANAAGARHALKEIKPHFTKARLEQWAAEFLLRIK